jgi:hypothetical protein
MNGGAGKSGKRLHREWKFGEDFLTRLTRRSLIVAMERGFLAGLETPACSIDRF